MYFQTQRPWFFWLIMAMIPFVLGLYTLIFFLEEGARNPVRMLLPFLPGMLILSVIAWAFNRYTVTADGTTLSFGYRGWRKQLQSAQIAEMEVQDIRWIKWGGQGVRMRGWKKVGYIIGNGAGVWLRTQDGWEYTFNCDDPAACIAAIKR